MLLCDAAQFSISFWQHQSSQLMEALYHRVPSRFCQQRQLLIPLGGYHSGVGVLSESLCSACIVDLEVSSQAPGDSRATGEASVVIHSD